MFCQSLGMHNTFAWQQDTIRNLPTCSLRSLSPYKLGAMKKKKHKPIVLMKVKVCIFVLIFMWCSGAAIAEQTIYLSVTASMTDAFKDILSGFSAAHPGAQLRPNFASSGSLAKQIAMGAPADIYVSANPKWMKYLAENKLIVPATERIFACNRLVFVGVEELADPSLASLPGLDRIALGNPKSVPAGQYAKQAMGSAGIYTILEREKKLVMAKDVRQALLYADRGEVDGAFVYRTDALLARKAKILFTVPDGLYDRVSYPLALTIAGEKNGLAKDFYRHMSNPEVIAVLRKYGFEPNR